MGADTKTELVWQIWAKSCGVLGATKVNDYTAWNTHLYRVKLSCKCICNQATHGLSSSYIGQEWVQNLWVQNEHFICESED